jgi:tetratricopeptide (TPR) repeat protein
MKRRTLTLALLLALLPASLLLAGAEGRLKGIVVDVDGKPILDADVLLSAQEVSAKREAKTKKGGKFVMIVADATRTYVIRIEKDGYQTIEEPVKLTIGGQLRKTWTLHAGETAEGASMVEARGAGAKIYNAGAKAFNNGDIDEALAKFIEAGEANPELSAAFEGQAKIYWSRKQSAEALAAAETVVALTPESPIGLRILYDAYVESGDERADATLEALIAADQSPTTATRVFNAGVSALKIGDNEGAIARFEKSVEIDPSLTYGHQILGQKYNSAGEHDKAIASAEKLLELAPGSTEAHSILYEAYQAKGDSEKAAISWSILKDANPVELAQVLATAGQQLWDAGQVDEAMAKLKQAVEANPEHPTAHYTLGLCYLNSGDMNAAKEHLQRFLEVSPEHPEAPSVREMVASLG